MMVSNFLYLPKTNSVLIWEILFLEKKMARKITDSKKREAKLVCQLVLFIAAINLPLASRKGNKMKKKNP